MQPNGWHKKQKQWLCEVRNNEQLEMLEEVSG